MAGFTRFHFENGTKITVRNKRITAIKEKDGHTTFMFSDGQRSNLTVPSKIERVERTTSSELLGLDWFDKKPNK